MALGDWATAVSVSDPESSTAWDIGFFDLAGNHQIWPTYDVYLIKRGTAVYKLQLIGYYSDTGEERHVSVRCARVEG